jgi:hypothetical protein
VPKETVGQALVRFVMSWSGLILEFRGKFELTWFGRVLVRQFEVYASDCGVPVWAHRLSDRVGTSCLAKFDVLEDSSWFLKILGLALANLGVVSARVIDFSDHKNVVVKVVCFVFDKICFLRVFLSDTVGSGIVIRESDRRSHLFFQIGG